MIQIRPAEAHRGCFFKNNSSTGYLINRQIKTLICKLKSPATGTITVTVKTGTTFTITAGNRFGFYSNATGVLGDATFAVSDWTLVEYVAMFTQQLSTDEITDYQNNTVWTYRNDKATYDIPMYSDTLYRDIKGNTITPSAAAPTKLVGSRGYDFNGSSNYLQLTGKSVNWYDVFFVVKPDWTTIEGAAYYAFLNPLTGAAVPLIGFNSLSGVVTGENIIIGSTGWRYNQTQFVAGNLYICLVHFNGTTYDIYMNGILTATTTYSSASGLLNTNVDLALGRRWVDATPTYKYYDGKILDFVLFGSSLTDMQVYDLMHETQRQYANNVWS